MNQRTLNSRWTNSHHSDLVSHAHVAVIKCLNLLGARHEGTVAILSKLLRTLCILLQKIMCLSKPNQALDEGSVVHNQCLHTKTKAWMDKGPDGADDRSPPLLRSYSDVDERTSISDSELTHLVPLVIELLEPMS
jgi:hypothetical protein